MIEVPPQHCPSLDELIKESRANPVGDLMDLHWAEDGIDIFLKAVSSSKRS
jgi:hypothetical protein